MLVPSGARTRPPRELADPDSRFARFAGVEVHHKVTGPIDALPVVLLHHFYGNVDTWRHVRRDLETDHRVAAFDRPAFGLTPRPPRRRWNGTHPYTRETSARITAELVADVGSGPAVLVGCSAGGTAALETYARAPERVRALVLIAPAITGDVGPPTQIRGWMRNPVLRRIGPPLVRRFVGEITRERVAGSWSDPGRATDEDVEAYARPMRVERWAQGYWELFAAEPPPNLSGLLPRIDVPTLVVSGDADRVISPAANRRTASAIPGAEYVEIAGSGHTPQEERPEELTRVIRRFLGGLRGR